MAYQALYRKWRPQTFEEVLGQTATVKTLRKQVESGRIGHAYLFCGCRGTGKTTMAKIMGRAVNCTSPHNGDPCGECPSCKAILDGTTMDVIEMDAASNSRVEEMRELLDQVMYPPQFGKYKVYIIDEVHMLSASAFNALLKTLEEPPAHIVFILATTEPQKIPATILSRVQRFDFGRIPASQMVERMKAALAEMSLTAEEESLQIVARSAEGAMRDAFSILDMCISAAEDGVIRADQVRDLLGASDQSFLFAFFDNLCDRDSGAVMQKVDFLMRSGREPQVFLKDLGNHCRSLLMVKSIAKDAASVLNITGDEEKELRTQAERFSGERLLSMLDLFARAEADLRYASSPRIGLESTVLHACERNTGEDSSALLERIAELETKLSEMESKIAQGNIVQRPMSRTAPAATEAARNAARQKEEEKPEEEKPSDEREIWNATIRCVLKQNPTMAGFIKKLRFAGVQDGLFLLEATRENHIAIDFFSRPDKREMLSAALKEAGGREIPFKLYVRENRETVKNTDGEKQLIDTFGRENIQISEGITE